MKPKNLVIITLLATIILILFFVNRRNKLHLIKTDTSTAIEKETSGPAQQLDNWFWQKGYPNADHITTQYQKAWQEFLSLKNRGTVNNATRSTHMTDWVSIGPKIFGGRVLSLAINRLTNSTGSRTLFAGSASGGIWKSYSAGVGATAWQPVVTNHNVLGVSSIVYHPTDTSILLAGTGEVYRVDTVINGANSSNQIGNIGRVVWKSRGTYGIGILRSSDAGATWTQVLFANTSSLFGIQKIRFDPTDANIVYACATDGLYKSTNAGINFSKVFNLTYVNDIAIDPANNQQLLIVNGNLDRTDKGIWRSTNGGTNFVKLNVASFPTATQYKGYVTLSVAGTAAPYTVFAGVGKGDVLTANTYTENELYRSTDFGSTWSLISNSNHSAFQAWFSHCITPFPVVGGTSTTKLFAMGVNRYVISISGTTGTRTTIGAGGATMNTYLAAGQQEGGSNYVHADVHEIQFVPGSTTEAYFATDGGIFRTSNADASPITNMTFSSCNGGLQIHQFYPTAAQSRTNPTLFVGGLQDNNVVRSRGTSWARVIGGDGGPCMFKPDNEAILLASNDARGVARSSDSGKTYGSNVLAYLGSLSAPNDNRAAFMSPIAVSKANTNRWYAGSDNIHISNDAGASFTNSGIPGTAYIEAFQKTAVAIAVSSLDANKLYVSISPFSQNTGTYGLNYAPPANIRKSINGGTSFTTTTGTLPDRIYSDIAISPTNDDSVFVTLGGFGTTHVYVTGDGGTTWLPRGSGLPDVPFNCILIDSANTNILYAGCDFGVYVSPDRGANWYDFNNGLWDATYVMDLVLAPGNKLKAVTHGKGIFETTRWDGTITLPATLLSFVGKYTQSGNELQWQTSMENGLRHYVIERSVNGLHFTTLANVNARNVSYSSFYHYSDNVIQGLPKKLFYRLKMLDQNGMYVYSNIIVIERNLQSEFAIIGNPFYSTLTVQYTLPELEPFLVFVYDAKGRLRRKEQIEPAAITGSFMLNHIESWESGMYIVQIQYRQFQKNLKAIKQ